jgi:hypothetical protein
MPPSWKVAVAAPRRLILLDGAYQTRSAASVRVSLIRDTRTLHRRLERPLPPLHLDQDPDDLLDHPGQRTSVTRQ